MGDLDDDLLDGDDLEIPLFSYCHMYLQFFFFEYFLILLPMAIISKKKKIIY